MRTLTTLTLTLLLTITHANNYTSAQIRDFIANETDGTTTPCLVDMPTVDTACYNQDNSQRTTKILLETFILTYSDLMWVTPWQEDRNTLSRFVAWTRTDSTQNFVIITLRLSEYKTHVVIFQTLD